MTDALVRVGAVHIGHDHIEEDERNDVSVGQELADCFLAVLSEDQAVAQ